MLARLGDVIRHWGGDHLLVGHQGTATDPICWRTRTIPHESPEQAFTSDYPYDFAEQDVAAPGGLVGFADPWSAWTESAAPAARGEKI